MITFNIWEVLALVFLAFTVGFLYGKVYFLYRKVYDQAKKQKDVIMEKHFPELVKDKDDEEKI